MTENSMPRVAIIADTSLQRGALQQALVNNGYQVVLNNSPSRLDEAALASSEVDLWLVDLALSEDSPLVDRLLQQTDAPVLYGEGQAPERQSEQYPLWEKRFFGKLKQLIGDSTSSVVESLEALYNDTDRVAALPLPAELEGTVLAAGTPAEQVWLLAGSLGAPQAVKAFIDALPTGLPVGFVYAQHINDGQEGSLAQAVGCHTDWTVRVAQEGEPVRCGEVVIAPVTRELSLGEGGAIRLAAHGWQEPYSPSIDQMVLNLVQRYTARSGVVLFSGTGSDGSSALGYARRHQAEVWAQRSESCECPSLPDSARATGHVTFSAEPRELAQAFIMRLVEQRNLAEGA
ncbi:chemotaxis protein CheB [Pseudomonas sp. Marseille-QA0892]